MQIFLINCKYFRWSGIIFMKRTKILVSSANTVFCSFIQYIFVAKLHLESLIFALHPKKILTFSKCCDSLFCDQRLALFACLQTKNCVLDQQCRQTWGPHGAFSAAVPPPPNTILDIQLRLPGITPPPNYIPPNLRNPSKTKQPLSPNHPTPKFKQTPGNQRKIQN